MRDALHRKIRASTSSATPFFGSRAQPFPAEEVYESCNGSVHIDTHAMKPKRQELRALSSASHHQMNGPPFTRKAKASRSKVKSDGRDACKECIESG